MAVEKIYRFRGIDYLHADERGNFFFNNKPVPKVYNNGSLAVRVGKTKYGLKKLRTLAYIASHLINESPFYT